MTGSPTGGRFSGTVWNGAQASPAGPPGAPPRGRPEFASLTLADLGINHPGVWTIPGRHVLRNVGYGDQLTIPQDYDRLIQRLSVAAIVKPVAATDLWGPYYFTFLFQLQETGSADDAEHTPKADSIDSAISSTYWHAFYQQDRFADVDAPIYPYLLPAGASIRFHAVVAWTADVDFAPADVSIGVTAEMTAA